MPKFERKDDKTSVAFLKCTTQDWLNPARKRTQLVATRAIKERNGWRVDQAHAVAGAWLPWEPISSRTFESLKAAKAEIGKFSRACGKIGHPERKTYGLAGRRTKKRRK